VESKSFAFSVLAGASVLRVEKRKKFLGVVILNSQSSEWLVSILEVLLGLPEEQEIVKSFKKGSKLLIARRGGNKNGRFLEVSSFGLGGQKGFIVIPEGRGGWGWIKFSDELRKVVDFLSGPVGCGSGSSSSSEKKEVKAVQPSLGLASKWTGPSFAEVLRSILAITAKELPSWVAVIPGQGLRCQSLVSLIFFRRCGMQSLYREQQWIASRWSRISSTCWTKTVLFIRRVRSVPLVQI
jgi:hypothetical protein